VCRQGPDHGDVDRSPFLFAGATVFVLTGFTPLRRVLERRDWILRTVASIAVLAVIVFGALAVSSDELELQTSELGILQDVVEDWNTRRWG
jgi:hypothetical protein